MKSNKIKSIKSQNQHIYKNKNSTKAQKFNKNLQNRFNEKTLISRAFKEEKTAKSPAFFATLDFFGIDNKLKSAIKTIARTRNKTARICLHTTSSEPLHLMLIYHPKPFSIPRQIFLNTESYYLLLRGAFSITNCDSGEVLHLRANGIFLAKIGAKINYQMKILSKDLLFIEVRLRENPAILEKTQNLIESKHQKAAPNEREREREI